MSFCAWTVLARTLFYLATKAGSRMQKDRSHTHRSPCPKCRIELELNFSQLEIIRWTDPSCALDVDIEANVDTDYQEGCFKLFCPFELH